MRCIHIYWFNCKVNVQLKNNQNKTVFVTLTSFHLWLTSRFLSQTVWISLSLSFSLEVHPAATNVCAHTNTLILLCLLWGQHRQKQINPVCWEPERMEEAKRDRREFYVHVDEHRQGCYVISSANFKWAI